MDLDIALRRNDLYFYKDVNRYERSVNLLLRLLTCWIISTQNLGTLLLGFSANFEAPHSRSLKEVSRLFQPRSPPEASVPCNSRNGRRAVSRFSGLEPEAVYLFGPVVPCYLQKFATPPKRFGEKERKKEGIASVRRHVVPGSIPTRVAPARPFLV